MKPKRLLSFLPVLSISLSYAQTTEKPKDESASSNVLEEVVVTANRADQTIYEQIQPGYKLSEDRLLLRMEPTVGETLNRLPGVSSTGFAPASSRPVIRGLGDDRVRMLQNGTSILDVANLSPDHAVSADPMSAQSIEVVRGPSTLLYGPNAVGGVVNVIDRRIAEERFTGTLPSGSIGLMAGTPDNSFSQSIDLNWGSGPWVLHFDYFHREMENLEIPGFARSSAQRALDDPDQEQARGFVPNSAADTEGFGFGASHVFENGFLGFSFSGMDSDYGVVAKDDVTIEMEQRRFDVRGAVYEPLSFLREIRFNLGYSDYEHTEFEGDETGTRFDIEGFNGRVEFMHKEVAGFLGTFGYEIEVSDFSAVGEEAFVPPVDTQKHSLFFLEEKEWGDWRYQFGMRLDHHSNERQATDDLGPALDVENTGFSVSTGVIYNITPAYAASASVAYTQRPPTNMELFANGPHYATGSYEVGDADLGNEDSFSIDLSIRKKSGWVTGFANAYYYRFNDFINLRNTGEFYEEEDHDDDHDDDHDHGHDELPIYNFEAVNADFYGFEMEAVFHLLAPITEAQADGQALPNERRLDLIVRSDYVHAENRDTNEALPRIAPFRAGATIEYATGPFTCFLEGQYSAEQNRVPENELPTDSFFLINAGISYKTSIGGVESTCFLRGVNLTDEEARLSTSFVRDIAPLAGRGIVAGIRTEF